MGHPTSPIPNLYTSSRLTRQIAIRLAESKTHANLLQVEQPIIVGRAEPTDIEPVGIAVEKAA